MKIKGLSLLIALFLILACGQEKSTTKAKKNTPTNFAEKWELVNSLEKKGLQKNAIQELNQILSNALAEKQYGSVFKALAIRAKYLQQIEEDSEEKIIQSFHTAIENSAPEGRRLLESALAELYGQYYTRQASRIKERSNLNTRDQKDISKMSAQELQAETDRLFASSTQDLGALENVALSNFLNILDFTRIDSSYIAHFSLADFLSNRALHHFEFKFKQAELSEPILASKELFADRAHFLKEHFSQRSKQSSLTNWMKILSNRLKADPNDFATTHFELYRLNTLKSWSINDSSDLFYEQALGNLINKAKEQANRDRIRAEKARFHHWQKENSKAIELCGKCEDEASLGSTLCESLIANIKQINHELNLESVYPSNKDILFAYGYQNLTKVHFRIYQVEGTVKEVVRHDKTWLKNQLRQPIHREWQKDLKDWKDYRKHRSELMIEALPNASYVLLASDREDFHPDSSHFSVAEFWVSDIAYFSRQNRQSGTFSLHLKDRTSGKALEGAIVNIYHFDRNRSAKEKWVLQKSLQTDKHGVVTIPTNEQYYGGQLLKIDYQGQNLIANEHHQFNHNRSSNKDRKITQFFTDRKIYQPGQLLHFKAILTSSNEYEEVVIANSNREVKILDPRGEELNRLKLTTNEFGSISGTFALPKHALNGVYRMVDANGSINFRVEEYRRPSFEVKFKEDERAYALGDTVAISGDLLTYTGLPINQAKVEYRIIQEDHYPAPHPYSSYWPQAKRVLIKSGTLELDKNEFTIAFNTDIRSRESSHFQFALELNVTSPLGENLEAEKRITLHRLPYSLEAELKEEVELKNLNALKIQAKDHQSKAIDVKGQIELWSLKTPSKVSIEKYWEGIDHQLIDRDTYENLFPYYTYDDRGNLENFSKSTLLNKQSFVSGKALNTYQNLKPGAYLLKAYSITEQGDSVKWSRRFMLNDLNSKSLPYPLSFSSTLLNDSLIQGEAIELLLASSFDDLEILAEVEFQGRVQEKRVIQLKNERKQIRFDTKGIKGRLIVHLSGIKAGRHILQSHSLEVHPKKKPFEIYLKTKRDLTQAGNQEKWAIGVRHLEAEEEVEVLGSMYDKSLDQLEDQSWKPYSSIHYRQKILWFKGFGSQMQWGKRFNPDFDQWQLLSIQHSPTAFNWFGFSIGGGLYEKIALSAVTIQDQDQGMSMNREVFEAEVIDNTQNESTKEENSFRKDFSETVFFEPHLKLSESEDAIFRFKMPDALTTYKFRALAHNNEFQFSTISHEIISKKQLMVSSYLPRFLRISDQGTLKVKVQNASGENQEGKLSMRFFDAQNGRAIDILELGADQSFSLLPNEEQISSFQFTAPEKVGLLKYELSAIGDQHRDVEVGYIQVLPSRLLVAESFPFEVQSGKSRELYYKEFAKKVGQVPENRLFKIEYSHDPRWMAVYALPAMLNEQDDCPEAVFSNLYTRALGSYTANQIEGLEGFMEQLKKEDNPTSQFELNQDVSLTDYESTPWINVARAENLQRKSLSKLFDDEQVASRVFDDLLLLDQLQLPSGAWPWFRGMRENRYLSQYILGGLEKLAGLKIIQKEDEQMRLRKMKDKVKAYLDVEIEKEYNRLSAKGIDTERDYLSPNMIHFLYSRSFDPKWKLRGAADFYLEEARAHWQDKNPMLRALIGQSFFQMNPNDQIVTQIAASLKNIAIRDSLGVHWKFNGNQPYWYNSAIEAQAYLIEFFQALSAQDPDLEGMKKWLLHQKKQQYWPGSKASIQACYALLAEDKPLSYSNSKTNLVVGNTLLSAANSKMPGSLSKPWEGSEINASLAKIKVEQKQTSFGWGTAHWQYFEESDQLKSHAKKGLQISSNYYSYEPTNNELKPLGDQIQLGQLIKHRLVIEVDYDMEFVYVNDQPPACLQPAENRSGVHYSDGLSYYANVKASEREWFIERLNRGTYILETDYRVSHSGNFTGGVSRLQSMYAPEFVAYDNAGSLEISNP